MIPDKIYLYETTRLVDTWFDNLTPNQILYYQAYSNGQKSPFTI